MTEEDLLDASVVTMSLNPSEAPRFPAVKILIVDDHEEGARALQNLIEVSWKMPEWPLNIVRASTLQDGLMHASDANCTFLDLDLPDSTPENTVAHIKCFPPPVTVLTGHAGMGAKCLEAGAEYVFEKGAVEALIPSLFASLQKDLIRRFYEVYGK